MDKSGPIEVVARRYLGRTLRFIDDWAQAVIDGAIGIPIGAIIGYQASWLICTISPELSATRSNGGMLLSDVRDRRVLLDVPDQYVRRYTPRIVELFGEAVAQPNEKVYGYKTKKIPEFPQICPNCKSPAYLGFNVTAICSKSCSKNLFLRGKAI